MGDFDNKDYEEELHNDFGLGDEEVSEDDYEEDTEDGQGAGNDVGYEKADAGKDGPEGNGGKEAVAPGGKAADGSGAEGTKEGEYEDVCFICRRPESKAGKMFKLPNHISVCNDCMHKTMDTVSQFDYQGMLGNINWNEELEKFNKGKGIPNISFVNLSDLQGEGGIPNKQKLKRKKGKEKEAPVLDIRNIPAPHKIKAQLDEYVVGQEKAKKIISVAVYNHYKRVATGTMDEIEIEKSNILMIGPTEVPVGASSKNAMVPMTTINTKNILFICGGAFPDLEEIIKQRLNKGASIGYGAELKDKYDKDKNILGKVTVEDIRKFGMIPEFLGRLPIICTLEGLGREMLIRILKEPKNAILKQYQKLLELDEVQLEFDDGALEAIADKAMEKDTGARALRAIIEEFMLDIMYEIPKDDNIGRVTITKEYIQNTGGPVIDIRSNSLESPDSLKVIEV